MKRILLILTVSFLLLGMTHKTVYASCTGFIDCLFGMTERTEVRAERDIEKARIEADAQAEIARIEGEAQARITQAEAEVERVRQLQYQSEADRDIAIAQAQAQADQYRAMIAGLTSEKIAGIQSNADTQIAALQAQAQIAIEGIVQTGQTERWRVGFGWAALIVVVVVLAVGWHSWLRRRPAVLVLPEQPKAKRLPWYDEGLEIVEVKNGTVARKY